MPLLAQLVVEYVADVSKLTSGVQAASNSMKSVNQSAESGASALRNFATGAAVLAGTALIGIGVASTKMAADFQQGITGLETSGNELHSNLKMVGDGILKMAVDTGTATTDLTKGMLQIESAGYHGADGLNVLKNAAEGAKTGQSSLKDVSNGLTTAMVDYHIPVSQAAETTNDLIATMKNGKTTMGELAASLKSVLPFASSAGISLNNVSAAMSTLTSQGIPAGQSATFLKTMILSLEAPSSKGAAVLKSIGLSAQDVSTKMKTSLPGALEMITNQLKTKFPEGSAAYTSALKDITGGSSSLAAVLGLTGANMATFKSNVDNIAGSVKSGGDSIQGWAVTQQDFNFQMDKAREVVETMGIKLGTALLPKVGELLSKIMPIITQFGNWLISSHFLENAFDALSNAIGGVVSVGTNIITFFQNNHAALAALQIALPIVAGLIGGALVFAFYLAAAAAWTAAAGFIAAAWPFILIGGAIAGLVVGFIWLYNNVKPFHDLIGQVGNIIQTKVWPVLQNVGAFLASVFVPIWQNLVSVWQTQLLPAFQQLWAALQPLSPLFMIIGGIIGGVLLLVFASLIGVITGLAKGIGAFVTGVATIIAGFIQTITGIIQIVTGVVRVIIDIFTGNFKDLGPALGQIWQGILNVLGGLWKGMVGAFQATFGTIWGLVSGFVQGVIGFFVSLYNSLVGHSIIPDMVNGAINWFIQLNIRAVQEVLALVTGVWNWFAQLPGKVMGFLNTLPGMISGLWNTIITNATNAGANIVNGIANGIRGAIGAVGSAIGAVTQFISDHLPHSPAKIGALKDLTEQGAEISNQVAKGMINGMPLLNTALDNITKPIALSVKTAGISAGSGVGTANTKSSSGNGPVVVQIEEKHYHYLDGRQITDTVMTNVKRELRGHGLKK